MSYDVGIGHLDPFISITGVLRVSHQFLWLSWRGSLLQENLPTP
jgi:hypothetical protein